MYTCFGWADAITCNRGSMDNKTCTVDARMVRRVVKEKLEGLDRGEQLGVEGQVKQLIQDATSIDNLSRLFCGWAAWL